MPMIEISQKDILRSKLITPGWYVVRIESANQKPSTDGGSINYPMEGVVIRNADNGDTTFEGCPTPANWNFNSKAIGFAIGFIEALGVKAEPGMRIELKNAEGKEIEVMIENNLYNGRMQNQINHKYRPLSKPVV